MSFPIPDQSSQVLSKEYYANASMASRPMTETELLEDRRRGLVNELQELETIIMFVKQGGISNDILNRLKRLYKEKA